MGAAAFAEAPELAVLVLLTVALAEDSCSQGGGAVGIEAGVELLVSGLVNGALES